MSGQAWSRRRIIRLWRAYRWKLAFVILVALGAWLYMTLLVEERPTKPRAVAERPVTVERTAAMKPLKLPDDEGPHVSGTEWWYYNGILNGAAGERYAFHATVFLYDGMVRHTVLHYSLSDLRSGKRVEKQVRTAGIPSDVTAAGFDFRQEGWRVSSDVKSHSIAIDAEGTRLALTMTDPHPPLLHKAKGSRTPGLIDYGQTGITYYYSRPRLAAVGSVDVGGTPLAVTGEVWFDHQWGDFESGRQGWNWFALQLDDGANMMIYQLFNPDGSLAQLTGTLQANGVTTALDSTDLKLTPVGVWRSARSGVRYPAGWIVDSPLGRLEIRPEKNESEFNGLETTFKYYWEGAVRVMGTRAGRGFLEMNGYDHIKSLQPQGAAAG